MSASQRPHPTLGRAIRVVRWEDGVRREWPTVNRAPLTEEQAVSACANIMAGVPVGRALARARGRA